jgi:hypothetical protein
MTFTTQYLCLLYRGYPRQQLLWGKGVGTKGSLSGRAPFRDVVSRLIGKTAAVSSCGVFGHS